MPRRPAIVPNSVLNLAIPAVLRRRLDEWLWSDVEGRVPKGAYMEFFSSRIREFFEHRPLDLGPYLGSFPGEHTVTGPTQTIAALQQHLQKGSDHDESNQIPLDLQSGASPLP
jgi:hypothetical protein